MVGSPYYIIFSWNSYCVWHLHIFYLVADSNIIISFTLLAMVKFYDDECWSKCLYLIFIIFQFKVSKDGDVCISILHEPGEDKFGYERAEERWLPIHTVETILLSVISMINEPNDESPANVDAAVSRYFTIYSLATFLFLL